MTTTHANKIFSQAAALGHFLVHSLVDEYKRASVVLLSMLILICLAAVAILASGIHIYDMHNRDMHNRSHDQRRGVVCHYQ